MQRFDKLSANGVRAILLLLLAALAAFTLPAAAQTFPKFTGLVVDDANVLSPETKAALTQKLEALQKDTKRQLVVVTVGDAQGYPLAEYGYKLGREWGVGLRDVNNGVILLIAPNNPPGQRGPRIEVGRGLEPILTDALSSVIIREQMMPRLRANNDVAGALAAGVDAIAQQLRASPEEAQARLDAATKTFDQQHKREGGRGFPIGIVFWVLVLGFVVLAMARRGAGGQRYRGDGGSGVGHVVMWTIANEIANAALRERGGGGWSGGGGWGGGSSGGSDGSWGGGGFTGGGGGDFGGGGASGDW